MCRSNRLSALVAAEWFKGGDLPYTDIPGVGQLTTTGLTTLLSTGDSIMNGSNASPASNAYRALFAAEHSLTDNNQAASGRGVLMEIYNVHNLNYTRSQVLMMKSGGLNDARRSNSTKCRNKIVSCFKTQLKKHFANSLNVVASGSSSVTRSGTFTGFDAALLGGRYPSGTIPNDVATFSSTANATWTWNFTIDSLLANTLFIGTSASDGTAARGGFEVYLDGVLIDTVTSADQQNRYDGVADGGALTLSDNKRGPDTKYYFDLTVGAHTLQIKALTTTPVVIDQIGVLDAPANLGPLLVLEIPKILNYNIAGLNQASDAYIDELNELIRAEIVPFRERGYPIWYIPMMATSGGDGLLTTGVGGDIDSDLVHRTNTGHANFFTSVNKRFA